VSRRTVAVMVALSLAALVAGAVGYGMAVGGCEDER
jgi:hypothetical protein